jgi:deoxycytidylate deaminase
VLSVSTRRKARLKDDGVNESEISELVERDRRQADKHGQQLDKTLQLADFFIRNDHANAEALSKQIRRFCDLIHGGVGITPTLEEYGMYVAYAAGLRSACLSRQVGASIMSQDGRILATGRNEVPRAGGGLYGPESGDNDARCVVLEGKQCFNDLHKRNLRRDIGEIIERELSKKINTVTEAITSISPEAAEIIKNDLTPGNLAEQLSNEAYAGTRLSSLIEFSRSIHAEMDAIVSLARSGTGATQGASLFTYTFPCHNCARHIVAAGISKVYFLEPYEKSLATDLHWDAIDVEPERPSTTDGVRSGKVQFVHFEGVAPRQYLNMFSINGERKDEQGKAITLSTRQSGKKVPEYLDDYRDYEAKVVQHLESLITELKQQQSA